MGTNLVPIGQIELIQGFGTTVMILLSRDKPATTLIQAPETITVASLAAADATTLTLATGGLPHPVQKGQWFKVSDADDNAYLFQLDADAADGATALTVKPLVEAIPANATGKFPVEILARTDFQESNTVNTQEAQNFNTGGSNIVTATTTSHTVTIPGNKMSKDPGYLTAFYAAVNKLPVWIMASKPVSNLDSAVLAPETYIAKAFCTDFPSDSPSDGFRAADLTFAVSGLPDWSLYAKKPA